MKIQKLKNFISQNSRLIIWLAIALYFIIFSLICIWKYLNFGYNGLDLAIINQAFYNSAQGNLFGLTIHSPSYLGDHFPLIMILLLPFYFLWQHPLNLLIMQSLILALCAWPLFLIARQKLSKNWSVFIALAWLLNPFVQNINLFEFHLLPFATFLLLWCFNYYQQKNFAGFLVFATLGLLVREDVALVIFMFSVLALVNKRTIKWIVWPGLMAASWFILATYMISLLTPTGSYKFLIYYSWLGGSMNEMITNAFTDPLLILKRFFHFNNWVFFAALLFPFTILFFDITLLLLGLLIFLQLSFGGSNNSLIVLKTHYSSLLLPSLFISYIYGLAKLFNNKFKRIKKIKNFLLKEKLLLILIIGATTIYSCLTLGPLPSVIKHIFKPIYSSEVKELKKEFYQDIPQSSSVAASYEFLTNLSSRPEIYSMHYAYIGKKQFSDIDYGLPDDTEILVFDFEDLLTYAVQFPNASMWKEYYLQGDDNFRRLIQEQGYGVTKVIDTLVRMDKNASSTIKLYQADSQLAEIQHVQNVNFNNGLSFLGWSKNLSIININHELLPISLYFQANQKLEKDYQFRLIIKNKNGQIVHKKLYALAYGLYPSSEWQVNEIVKMNYWFLIPERLAGSEYNAEVELVYLEGFLKLNGLRSAIPYITEETALEPILELIP